MSLRLIKTAAYFDGVSIHRNGPYLIEIRRGYIAAILDGEDIRLRLNVEENDVLETSFLMPGLVDAHVHVFLDGAELNFKARSDYQKSDFEIMMATARSNISKTVKAGITLSRDAGDKFGVNHAIRNELLNDNDIPLTIRSSGIGIKKPKRYGGFIARDLVDIGQADTIVEEIARDSNDLKIILTGIIDFKAGEVKGDPQFTLEELSALVDISHAKGMQTFAHCSGLAGLELAIKARVDSIEHGFFMNKEILEKMAEHQIAWVPTFSPVYFQWKYPEYAGWDENTVENLRRIIDSHYQHVKIAQALGVLLVAGSDAGSYGVDHGRALIDELLHFLAAGLSLEEALTSATSRPRTLWSLPSANIEVGNQIDVVGFKSCPLKKANNFYFPSFTVKADTFTAHNI